jgi:MarR family 2-MHQ and catechol resistance regulon transcriptional repressor
MRFDQASIRRAGFRSLSDFAVLEILLHKGALPVTTIGERVMLTSGSITTAVQRLEKRGLVQRSRDERDGRVVLVQLTPAGQALIEQSFAEHSAELDHLFEVFDEAERANFATLIAKLSAYAESLNH